VKLFEADQKLREAQGRLDAASKNVRIQEKKVSHLVERQRLAQQHLKEQQSRYGQFDLDVKTREARIEKLRTQQQTAHTNKEYQTFLVEINTEKVDKGKAEDEALRVMDLVEKGQAEVKEVSALVEAEQARLTQMRGEIGDKVAALQVEIESLRPARDAAYEAVSPKGREAFDRQADRYEGEAMAALVKPNPREEEYMCGGCNMSLVVDVYNRLKTRDDIISCRACGRILYIPEDLTPETAVHKKKEPKAPRVKKSKVDNKAAAAGAPRQQSAVDVLRSIEVQDDESQESSEPQESSESQSSPATENSAQTQDANGSSGS
jgi:predicted  nucleic acid-binding Zn-ribbon protein